MPDPTPDEVMEAATLVVRQLHVEDASSLHDAIVASVEHLRPWMPWAADEPLPLARRVALIEHWNTLWDDGVDFAYGIFLDGAVVGGCGLHPRIGPGGLEIVYWVHVDHWGKGFATAAADALVAAAFRLAHIDHIEIHHDKANMPSGRVPAKLGFTLVREVADEPQAPGEVGLSCEWRMDRSRERSTS